MNNEPIIRLLLERGAAPDDDVLYSAGWAADPTRCLRLLIDHGAKVAELAEQALAAPISTNDLEAVRVLLEAGADPARYRNDDGQPCSVVSAGADCSARRRWRGVSGGRRTARQALHRR
jgi:ankyrin repeat protein